MAVRHRFLLYFLDFCRFLTTLVFIFGLKCIFYSLNCKGYEMKNYDQNEDRNSRCAVAVEVQQDIIEGAIPASGEVWELENFRNSRYCEACYKGYKEGQELSLKSFSENDEI